MKKNEIKRRIMHKISQKYGVVLSELFSSSKVECNQCHSNCNDCGWDR